jgi:hypothetical protein
MIVQNEPQFPYSITATTDFDTSIATEVQVSVNLTEENDKGTNQATVDDESQDLVTIAWLACAANLAHMVTLLNECQTLSEETKAAIPPSPQRLAANAREFGKRLHEGSKMLQESALILEQQTAMKQSKGQLNHTTVIESYDND